MSDIDDHLARFKAHYDRIKHLNRDEKWKVATAERFASNPGMSFLIDPDTLSLLPPFPFEPADYADSKQPSRIGGGRP